MDSFIIFTESWSGIQLLSLEQRGLLLTALMAHHGACEMPEMDLTTKAVMLMMLPRMDANRKRYEATVERRRQAGAKGGRAKQGEAKPSNAKQSQAMLSNASTGATLPSNAKQRTPDTDTGSDTDTDSENTSYSNSYSRPKASAEPPVSDAGASDVCAEEQPVPGWTEQPIPVDDPEQPPLPANAPDHAALDDCPLCQQQPAPTRAPRSRQQQAFPREADWDAWYADYPRHEGKVAARKAWAAAVKAGVLPELPVLLDALRWQKAQRWDQPKFIPLPATYLNGRRWEDERPGPETITAHARPGRPDRELSLEERIARNAAIVMQMYEEDSSNADAR